MWLIMAALSAFFAGLTAILAKCGIKKTDSDVATALLAIGVFLMIEKKTSEAKETKRTWLPYAVSSAVFAALTSVLGKIGISGVESNLGTAIRNGVVLVIAWLIVLAKGKGSQLKKLDRRELVFI